MDVVARCRLVLNRYQPRAITDAAAAPAAVLVPFYQLNGQDHLIVTKRTELVEHHRGQISFPGGAFAVHDGDLMTTALRETYEEIGVRSRDVEIIGQLDDVLTVSDFRVTPYVGIISRTPYPFVASAREVAAILEVPLSHLSDEANLVWERRWRGGREIEMLGYRFGEHVIWGATAGILKQLLDLLSAPL